MVQFFRPLRSTGPIQALRGVMVRGSSLPPSLEPGGHPRISWISPNLNILRPLLGPDGVAQPSHPVTFLLSGEGWGHQAGVVPPATALAAPQRFALPLQDPKNTSEGILAWMSSGQAKAQGCLCLLHRILCPTQSHCPHQDRDTAPAKPSGLS